MAANSSSLTITVTRGPSLRVPFAAVIGDFDLSPKSTALDASILPLLARWLPPECLSRLKTPETVNDLPQWIERLTLAITEMRGRLGCPSACGSTPTRGWVALGYLDPQTTQNALRIAHTVLDATLTGMDDATIKSRATDAINFQQQLRASDTTRALVRASRLRNIPVYPVAPELQIWQYGQGHKGWRLHYSSTQADSVPGFLMQQNKAVSNNMVHRLGLPGTEHGLATRLQQAVVLARRIGYPVVIKPLDSGQGYGVTVGVRNAEEVAAAFSLAMKYSRQRSVIVERYVAGDDYRLVVTGGRFQWGMRRNPPEVMGDGVSSIAALIARKNAGLSAEQVDAGFVKPVKVDYALHRTLAVQGWKVDGRPPQGDVIRLRSVANLSTGGSFTDVTAIVHPDNRAMAETIARAFRLDNMGMDLITPDIERSWCDVDCAVIEVNTTPMPVSEAYAMQLIDSNFPNGDDGRLPSLLVLADNPAQMRQLYGTWNQPGRGVGIAAPNRARLDGLERRFAAVGNAHRAVTSLLLDPACNALLILSTFDGIRRHGLPLDRCSAAVWLTASGPDADIRALLDSACDQTMRTTADAIPETLHKLR